MLSILNTNPGSSVLREDVNHSSLILAPLGQGLPMENKESLVPVSRPDTFIYSSPDVHIQYATVVASILPSSTRMASKRPTASGTVCMMPKTG
jgi:hypothetical protein